MSAGQDMAKARRGMMDDAERFVRAVNLELMTSIIMDTPVGNPEGWRVTYKPNDYVGGRLRSNWQASEGSPATGEIEGTNWDHAISGVERVAAKGFGLFWLSNNLPYAIPVEYDGHSHTQAPAGMLRKNVTRIRQIIAKHNAK